MTFISITSTVPIGFNVEGVWNTENVTIALVETITDLTLMESVHNGVVPKMDGMKFMQLFQGADGNGSAALDIKSRLESTDCKNALLAKINEAFTADKHWISMYFSFDCVTFAGNMRATELRMLPWDWVEDGIIQFVFKFANDTLNISKTISVNYRMAHPPPM
jgi:hypothetical protein